MLSTTPSSSKFGQTTNRAQWKANYVKYHGKETLGPSSQPEHVAFVVNNYLPHIGGVETHVAQLASALHELGVTVSVIAVDHVLGSGTEGGVSVTRLPGTRPIGGVLALPRLGSGKALRQLLRERGATAISIHTRFFPMSFLGARAGKKLGVPVIMTEHGSDHVRGVSPAIGAASRVIDLTLGRMTMKKATKVLGISEGSVNFVKRLSGISAQLFYNAIDTSKYKPSEQPPLYPEKKLVFLGRLVPGKGWETALDTLEEMQDSNEDITLHIIGDGPDRHKLKQRVESSATLKENVKIHGFKDSEFIKNILRFGILINPTRLSEGFQTTLLEAVCSNAKIISTPVFAAKYLEGLGTQTTIVDSEDPRKWAEATQMALDSPIHPPEDDLLKNFDWSVRARQYRKITQDLAI